MVHNPRPHGPKGVTMKNPWEEIGLEDYENHMKLDSVKQLQTLNSIMKAQFDKYPVTTAMVLGVAGGNGLEHVDCGKYSTVYGVDINEKYLDAVAARFAGMMDSGVLKLLKMDLVSEPDKLPQAELLIANLLIEYIGYDAFAKAVSTVKPRFVSCVIQINDDVGNWVSNSPYIHSFDKLNEVHHQMEEEELAEVMERVGYSLRFRLKECLPNGKALVRMDFEDDDALR